MGLESNAHRWEGVGERIHWREKPNDRDEGDDCGGGDEVEDVVEGLALDDQVVVKHRVVVRAARVLLLFPDHWKWGTKIFLLWLGSAPSNPRFSAPLVVAPRANSFSMLDVLSGLSRVEGLRFSRDNPFSSCLEQRIRQWEIAFLCGMTFSQLVSPTNYFPFPRNYRGSPEHSMRRSPESSRVR